MMKSKPIILVFLVLSVVILFGSCSSIDKPIIHHEEFNYIEANNYEDDYIPAKVRSIYDGDTIIVKINSSDFRQD